jgi:hypothetical protein
MYKKIIFQHEKFYHNDLHNFDCNFTRMSNIFLSKKWCKIAKHLQVICKCIRESMARNTLFLMIKNLLQNLFPGKLYETKFMHQILKLCLYHGIVQQISFINKSMQTLIKLFTQVNYKIHQ